MSDEFNYWTLIEQAYDSVSIYDGPSIFRRDFDSHPAHVQHLLAAHWFNSEFCNGGFHQFFYNPTGVLAPEAVAGLRAIGMHRVSEVLTSAMNRLGPSYPRDRDARISIVGESPAEGMSFEELDEKLGAEYESMYACERDSWTDVFERAANAYAKRFPEHV